MYVRTGCGYCLWLLSISISISMDNNPEACGCVCLVCLLFSTAHTVRCYAQANYRKHTTTPYGTAAFFLMLADSFCVAVAVAVVLFLSGARFSNRQF